VDDKFDKWLERINLHGPSLSNFPNRFRYQLYCDGRCGTRRRRETGQVGLDSGIRVSATPATATVPVGITPAQTVTFFPSFQNSPPLNAQFRLVQFDSASSNLLDRSPKPPVDSCDPTCGTIDNNGVYTAPATCRRTPKPPQTSKSTAPTTVFVVIRHLRILATFCGHDHPHKRDHEPVTFSSLYPSTVAAGGVLQDVFLKAITC